MRKKVITQSLLNLFCKATPYIKNCNRQIYCKNLLAFGGKAGEFSFIYFLVYIHAQKNKMEIPCIVLLLGGAGGVFLFVCFVLFCFVFVFVFFFYIVSPATATVRL